MARGSAAKDYTRTFRIARSDRAAQSMRHRYVMSLLIITVHLMIICPLSRSCNKTRLAIGERQQRRCKALTYSGVMRKSLAQRRLKAERVICGGWNCTARTQALRNLSIVS